MIVLACQIGGCTTDPRPGALYCARHSISDLELDRIAAECTPLAVIAQVALGRYQLAGRPASSRARQLAREYCAARRAADARFDGSDVRGRHQPQRTETP